MRVLAALTDASSPRFALQRDDLYMLIGVSLYVVVYKSLIRYTVKKI